MNRGKTETFTFRLSPDLKRRLVLHATAKGCEPADIVREAIHLRTPAIEFLLKSKSSRQIKEKSMKIEIDACAAGSICKATAETR